MKNDQTKDEAFDTSGDIKFPQRYQKFRSEIVDPWRDDNDKTDDELREYNINVSDYLILISSIGTMNFWPNYKQLKDRLFSETPEVKKIIYNELRHKIESIYEISILKEDDLTNEYDDFFRFAFFIEYELVEKLSDFVVHVLFKVDENYDFDIISKLMTFIDLTKKLTPEIIKNHFEISKFLEYLKTIDYKLWERVSTIESNKLLEIFSKKCYDYNINVMIISKAMDEITKDENIDQS